MGVSVDYDREEVSVKRSVFKSGGSHVVSIPPEILAEAGFGPNDDIEVVHQRGEDGVAIRPAKNETDG